MKANFETGLKICGHCKRELPIEMFYKSSRTSDGLSCSCNDCRKEYRQSQSGREVSKKQELNIRKNIVKNINKYVKQKNGKKNIEIIIIPKKVEKEKD